MKASELARVLGGTLEGDDVELAACGGREEARPGDLSFCKDTKHVKLVESTKASAVLLPPEWDRGAPCSVIRVADPDRACMAAADECGAKSIAFCCISTGVFGFPQKLGAQIAVKTVRDCLAHGAKVGKVIFNVFKPEDEEYYREELGK